MSPTTPPPSAGNVDNPSARPEPGPEDARERYVRQETLHDVIANFPLGSAGALALMGLAFAYYGPRLSGSWIGPMVALLLAVHGLHLAIWWVWTRRDRSRPVHRHLCAALAAHVALMGLVEAALYLQLFQLSRADEQLFVVATWVAVVAIGGWMGSATREVGLGWTLTAGGASALGSLVLGHGQSMVQGALLCFFTVFLSLALLGTSRMARLRMEAQFEVAQQRQLIGLLLNDFESNASDWLWETDRHGQLVHVSQRLGQLVRQRPEQLRGQPLVKLVRSLAAMDAAEADRLEDALRGGMAFRDVIVPVVLDGVPCWWSFSARPLHDPQGAFSGWRGVGSDVTAVQERDRELVRLANRDSLTGLANRHHFHGSLASHFGPDGRPCTLLILDLDNFKTINDSLGHAAGDAVLQIVAQRLQGIAPPDTLVARLGGDEFALLLSGDRQSAAVHALYLPLRETLRAPCTVAGHELEIHASIGAASAPADAATAEALLLHADLALYAAKAAGRGMLRFFDPAMETAARGKISLLADLREGLRQGQFLLHYQPQLHLHSGQLVGFEALVRWRHPSRGLVSPAEFIPLAEESGLIIPLGAWVMSQACLDAARWPAGLSVAVNVSAVEFEKSDLVATVQQALRASGLKPGRLEVELTESTLLQDMQRGLALLESLRAAGVRLALDDFGTGFSSLAYLRSFPLDKLKIDRSFVRTLTDGGDERSEAIVQAILHLARALRLEVTSEGIENTAQHQMLADIGCDYGQGFLYARPLPLQDLPAYMASQAIRAEGLAAALAWPTACPTAAKARQAATIAG